MSDLLEGAQQIAEKYQRWAFVAGVIPVPYVDMVTLSAVNLRMISDLSKHYSVEFSESGAKKVIGALLGGALPAVGASFVGSSIKAVPFIGTVLGAFTMPVFATTATTGVGKVFVQHFEKGGTFQDLDEKKAGESFKTEFEKASQEKASQESEPTPDDLTSIVGIGPKIQALLQAGGITTFAQLAATEVSDLEAILTQAGRRFQTHDPSTWPEQAKAAMAC